MSHDSVLVLVYISSVMTFSSSDNFRISGLILDFDCYELYFVAYGHLHAMYSRYACMTGEVLFAVVIIISRFDDFWSFLLEKTVQI